MAVIDMIDWAKLQCFIPTIVQDVDTSVVLAVTQTSQPMMQQLIDGLNPSLKQPEDSPHPIAQQLFVDCDLDCLLVKAKASDAQRAESRTFFTPLSQQVPQDLFTRSKLVLAVTQCVEQRNVLMAAFMHQEALELTLKTGFVHYFSRKRQKLWKKGEESGHLQHLVAGSYDLKAHALVLDIRQEGPACHDNYRSCFYRRVNADGTLGIDGLYMAGSRTMTFRIGRII